MHDRAAPLIPQFSQGRFLEPIRKPPHPDPLPRCAGREGTIGAAKRARKLATFYSLLLLGQCLLGATPTLAQDESSASPTRWVSAQGKAIEADYVRLDEESVVLRLKTTGKEVTVPLSALSLESHLQALKLTEPEAYNKPLVKAPVMPVIEDYEPAIVLDGAELLKSPFAAETTIEQFLDTLNAELERGNLFVLWHALPPKMQTDGETVLVQNLSAVTQPHLAQIQALTNSLNRITREKRDFIFALPTVASHPQLLALLEQEWPKIASFSDALSEQANWQADNFKKGKILPWLANISARFAPYIDEALQEVVGSGKVLQYTIARQSADSADIDLQIAGYPQPLKVRFQKLGNIWLVPEWMNDLRAQVDERLQPSSQKIDAAPLNLALVSLNAAVGGLERAETQEAFDETAGQVLSLLQGTPGIAAWLEWVTAWVDSATVGESADASGGTAAAESQDAPEGTSSTQSLRPRSGS